MLPVQMKYAQATTTSASRTRHRASTPGVQRRVEDPEVFLDEESRDARPGVDRREDEQRLEHDGEVVPVVHQPAHAGQAGEDLRDADGERYGAARPPRDASPTAASSSGRLTIGMPRFANVAGGGVDGEVVAGMHGRGGDQRHDADEPFHQHRAVADRPDVGLPVDHLRRGARRDQRMEAGDRAARNRDEGERENRPRDDRPAAAGELAERRHCRVGLTMITASTRKAIVPIFM